MAQAQTIEPTNFDEINFQITSKENPDAYIESRFVPGNSAYARSSEEDGKTLVGYVDATVYVEETYTKGEDGNIFTTDSRLLSEEEVMSIGKSEFDVPVQSVQPRISTIGDKTTSRGKLTIRFTVMAYSQARRYQLNLTSNWSGLSWLSTGDTNSPGWGDDIMGFRIWYINSSVITIPVETYKVGEWVELDGAFQDVSYENTDGYSLRVKSAAIKSYSDFVREYGESEDYMEEDIRPELVLDVEFEFSNKGNTEGQIELFQYFVEGRYFTMVPNSSLWFLTVPKGEGQMGFVLDQDTSFEFHVPYIFRQMGSVELTGEKIHIIASRAPVKKMIEIQL